MSLSTWWGSCGGLIATVPCIAPVQRPLSTAVATLGSSGHTWWRVAGCLLPPSRRGTPRDQTSNICTHRRGDCPRECFDGAIGTVELTLVKWIVQHRNGVLDTVATQGSAVSDTWTVIGVLVGSVIMMLATRHVRYAALLSIGIGLELMRFFVGGSIVGQQRPAAAALDQVPC
jgi:hypothetical protein